MDDVRVPIPAGSTRFMDQLRTDMRARGYALATERTYLHWIRRYIIFSHRRHPKDCRLFHEIYRKCCIRLVHLG